MSYVRVWRFRPLPNRVAAFEQAYGPAGDWARLFRTADGFLGTTLLVGGGEPAEYLTLDRWVSAQAYEAFRRARQAEFTALDRECESLTAQEEEIGEYEESGPPRATAGS
jgi:heme-degrading monooxygenase HmoA